MKATGIVRRIDDLGRVVIPKEIRRTLNIREGDPLEIFVGENGSVVFQKYETPAEDKAAFAQKWLENNALPIRATSAKFSIENKTTTCEVVSNNSRRIGTATTNVRDTFIPAVGMVIAFVEPLAELFRRNCLRIKKIA